MGHSWAGCFGGCSQSAASTLGGCSQSALAPLAARPQPAPAFEPAGASVWSVSRPSRCPVVRCSALWRTCRQSACAPAAWSVVCVVCQPSPCVLSSKAGAVRVPGGLPKEPAQPGSRQPPKELAAAWVPAAPKAASPTIIIEFNNSIIAFHN